MKIGVMVLEGPYQHQAADSAYKFVQAALARGHEIVGVFLYTDGVNVANQFIKPPGERNIAERFNELGAQGIDVVACTGNFAACGPTSRSSTCGCPGWARCLSTCVRPIALCVSGTEENLTWIQ